MVTGAFGYSGKYITGRLLAAGAREGTVTNSPRREHPFGDAVEAHPYNFDNPDQLVRSLEGARVLVHVSITNPPRSRGFPTSVARPSWRRRFARRGRPTRS